VKKFLLLFVVISVAVFFLPLKALDLPALKGHVNDYADIISPAVKEKIESRLESIDESDSTQIVVVTINSLEGTPIEDFGIQLAEKWKIGQVRKDNGVLFIVSKTDKQMRIEVGRGLEGVLTDLRAGRIIDNVVRPRFQSGDYDAGFLDGTEAIIAACRGEFKNDTPKTSKGNGIGTPFILIIIGIYIAIVVLSNISRALASVAGGVALPLLVTFGLFHLGLIGIIVVALIGLLLGFIIPLIPIGGGGSSSGGGFWSGGSGSGGGFSGGGGSFGGGGSSGGW